MKKALLLIQSFMFFFFIFIIQNKENIFLNFKGKDILSISICITNIVFILLVCVGIFVFLYFIKACKGTKELPEKVSEINQDKEVSLIFFATYIIPLLTIEIDEIGKLIGFWIVLGLTLVLCWKTDLWFANPILTILDYKIYKYKSSIDGKEQILISKQNIDMNDYIEKMEISNGVIFARKKEKIDGNKK